MYVIADTENIVTFVEGPFYYSSDFDSLYKVRTVLRFEFHQVWRYISNPENHNISRIFHTIICFVLLIVFLYSFLNKAINSDLYYN